MIELIASLRAVLDKTGRADFNCQSTLTRDQCLNKCLGQWFSANKVYIYWGSLWGQTFCFFVTWWMSSQASMHLPLTKNVTNNWILKMEGIQHKAGKQVSMKQSSVGSCINRKGEFSDTNFEIRKPCQHFNWMLSPWKYLDEMLARFSDLQVSIRELSFPM